MLGRSERLLQVSSQGKNRHKEANAGSEFKL